MFVRQMNALYLEGFGKTATIFLLLEQRNGEVRKTAVMDTQNNVQRKAR